MTREELEHAIRATCDVVGDAELWVFGSQSILGQHPEAPEAVRMSIEVDVDPKNRPELVDRIDGVLGEGSPFHETHGFYVHGVSIETAVVPRGWQQRTKVVRNENTLGATGYCLEAHDLAVSKLAAWRDKDREFVPRYRLSLPPFVTAVPPFVALLASVANGSHLLRYGPAV